MLFLFSPFYFYVIFTLKTFLSFFSIHCLSYFPPLFRNLYSTHLFHTDKTSCDFLHIGMCVDRYAHTEPRPQKVFPYHLCLEGGFKKKNHKLYDIYFFYLSDYLTLYNRLSFIKHTLQLAQVHSFLCLSNVPLYICTTTSLSIHLYGGMAGREAQQGGDIYIIMTGLHWCIPQHCKAIILQFKKNAQLTQFIGYN